MARRVRTKAPQRKAKAPKPVSRKKNQPLQHSSDADPVIPVSLRKGVATEIAEPTRPLVERCEFCGATDAQGHYEACPKAVAKVVPLSLWRRAWARVRGVFA